MLRGKHLWILLIALIAVCGVCGATGRWLIQPADIDAPPRVGFRAPTSDLQVAIGQSVEVQAWGYTPDAQAHMARLILWADGHMVGEKPGPGNPLVNIWTWTPTQAGSHTLVLEGVDSAGRKAAAYRTIVVQPTADDPDADGVPQGQDACPDQPGLIAFNGCPEGMPDQDGDGVPDAEDACLDQAGVAEAQGCPSVQANDADGDGVPDAEDVCPQSPGPQEGQGCPLPADSDGDGIPDSQDPCPQVFAPNGGCPPAPDADGDGVPDEQDLCPGQPGPAEAQGCPVLDTDSDGIPDEQDLCPDQAGPVNTQGCPTPQNNDTDGDGVLDLNDACPQHPGPPENLGCPLSDQDGDGLPDDQDACPNQAGPVGNNGCPQPDQDGDGLPDEQDACPQIPGPPGNQGCPFEDNDGDGIPNPVDACPELAGDPAQNGCPAWIQGLGDGFPEVGIPPMCQLAPWLCENQTDMDNDGVPDGADACPEEAGPPLNQGCPWIPGHGPDTPQISCPTFLPEDLCQNLHHNWYADQWQRWQDLWAHNQPPFPPGWAAPPMPTENEPGFEGPWGPVTLHLDELVTNTGWIQLYCSANIADMGWVFLDADHLLPTSADRTHWRPAEEYSAVEIEEVTPPGLSVHLVCWGWRDVSEGEVDLGDVIAMFTADQVLNAPPVVHVFHSVGGEAGHDFRATLRVCAPDCP